MKKFVKLTQTYTVMAIMDIDEKDTKESIRNRVDIHCRNNGGCENVITCGGDISVEIVDTKLPKPQDEENYECID